MTDPKELTRADLEAYRARWEAVNRFQIEEIRRSPIALRLKETNLLFRLAQSLKLRHAVDDPEIVAVRARWLRLKAHLP